MVALRRNRVFFISSWGWASYWWLFYVKIVKCAVYSCFLGYLWIICSGLLGLAKNTLWRFEVIYVVSLVWKWHAYKQHVWFSAYKILKSEFDGAENLVLLFCSTNCRFKYQWLLESSDHLCTIQGCLSSTLVDLCIKIYVVWSVAWGLSFHLLCRNK